MAQMQMHSWYGVSSSDGEALFAGSPSDAQRFRYDCMAFFKKNHASQFKRYFPEANGAGKIGPCSNLKNFNKWAGKTFRFSKSAKGDLRIVDIRSRRNKLLHRANGQ